MDIENAFVLNSIDYKDNSKILYLYTDKGHLSVIAHGVKKMNSINRFLSQNGTQIKLSISKGSFPSLKEGEIIEEYEEIKKDIIAYSFMNHIMELVKNVVSDDLNHHKMFSFLEKLFKRMNQDVDPELLSFIFELKLLYFIGYGLNFKGCNICSNDENLVFHVSSGGLVCREHLMFTDLSYNEDIYSILKYLYYIDIDKHEIITITDSEKITIRRIIDMLIEEFVSFRTKSRNIIKQIKKY